MHETSQNNPKLGYKANPNLSRCFQIEDALYQINICQANPEDIHGSTYTITKKIEAWELMLR